jgi:hypothetical protein
MPEAFTVRVIGSAGGDTFTEDVAESGTALERASPSVPAAKVGVVTTKTDANTATLTMNSGHGFVTNDKIDVFWAGGSRRNLTATVTVNSVVADGGSGDDFPASATAITAMKPVEVPLTVDGDTALGIGLQNGASQPGYVVFVDDEAAEVAAATFKLAASRGKSWTDSSGLTNPLAGVVTSLAKFSHGDATAARTMKATVVTG